MTPNQALSIEIAKTIQADPQYCWFNCRRAISKISRLSKATYVEGYVVEGSIPIPHAWIEHEGEIIDPTIVLVDSLAGHTYFAGLRWEGRRAVIDFARKNKLRDRPFSSYWGYGGWQSQSFMNAKSVAHRSVWGIDFICYEGFVPGVNTYQDTIVSPDPK